ncbi:MAG: cupin domain-containing protein [Christensenellaceae bacterium]|jgi:quercetin dioxygenase-like cupin family protein
MVRREATVKERPNMRGGNGTVALHDWLAEGELCKNVRVLSEIHLPAGASIGAHDHHGEAEIFKIISGSGKYTDNWAVYPVEAGDVLVCYSGENHGIENTGDDELIFFALVVQE